MLQVNIFYSFNFEKLLAYNIDSLKVLYVNDNITWFLNKIYVAVVALYTLMILNQIIITW